MDPTGIDELNALLDEDTSDDGKRLADFLLKKRGPTNVQRVFDLVPQRLSSFHINIQRVETTKTVQTEVVPPEQEGAQKDQKEDERTEKCLPLVEKQLNQLQKNAVSVAQKLSKQEFQISPNSAPLRSPSQRFSVRKSGGIPSADRLRRYSMKRTSTAASASGRRTLLQEFDNTVSNSVFAPNFCSTPMGRDRQSQPESLETIKNLNAPIVAKSTVTSTCPDTQDSGTDNIQDLLIDLHEQNKALNSMLQEEPNKSIKNIIGDVLRTPEKNQSPSFRRRTYTIEKGTKPGQVILTPSRRPAESESKNEQEKTLTNEPRPESPVEEAVYALHTGSPFKTPEKAPSLPAKSPILASPKVFEILQRLSGRTPQKTTSAVKSRIPLRTRLNKVLDTSAEIPNTQVLNVVAEHNEENRTFDVVIPETQGQNVSNILPPHTSELMKSMQKSPYVVIPIYQTFNQQHQNNESKNKANTLIAGDNLPVATETTTDEPCEPKTKSISKTKLVANQNHESKDKTNTLTACDNMPVAAETTRNEPCEPNIIISKAKLVEKGVNTTLNKTLNRTVPNKSVLGQQSISKTIVSTPNTKDQNTLFDYIEVDDNLRFGDIITDDEDERQIPSTSIVQKRHRNGFPETTLENSSAPLNLAHSTDTNASKCLRKRSSRRKIITRNVVDDEIWPPRAHALTLSRKPTRTPQPRRKATLNAAPRTPINGEKFANELKLNLARLRNHEILDLRKRNSLGKIYCISSHETTTKKNAAVDYQLKLEKQIQLELIRRNLHDLAADGMAPIVTEREEYTEDQHENGDIIEIPPAPDGFRDPSMHLNDVDVVEHNEAVMRQLLKTPQNSSLVDERSYDKISFVPLPARRSSKENKSQRISRRPKQSIPADVQKYLDISNKIAKHKQSDKSKRHLYSTYSKDWEASPPKSQRISGASNNEDDLHLRVSTPSPLLSSSEIGSTSCGFGTIEIQPLQPPEGFIDNNTEGEIGINRKSTSPLEKQNKKQRKATDRKSTDRISNNAANKILSAETHADDNHVFKKPYTPPVLKKQKISIKKNSKKAVVKEISGLEMISSTCETSDNDMLKQTQLPAPKKRRQKNVKATEKDENQTVEQTAEPIETNEATGLRRSKRGHKPLRNYWSFRSTDPTPLYDFAILEIRKEEAKRLREQRKNSTAASIRSDASEYVPIASSTALKEKNPKNTPKKVNKAKQKVNEKAQKSRTKKIIAKPADLGDTNTTGASSQYSTSPQPKRKRLDVILEEIPQNTNAVQYEKELPHPSADFIPMQGMVEKLNDMFDQLKNASTINENSSQQPSTSSSSNSNEKLTKNLRIRLKRVNLQNQEKEALPKRGPTKKNTGSKKKTKDPPNVVAVDNATVAAAAPENQIVDIENENHPKQKDSEVLSWLQNISFVNSKPGKKNQNIFEEMRCLGSGNLVLSNLDGLEYAYYDDDPDTNLSYLRFNPKQIKPAKRARKYNLNFLVLMGTFLFSTNKDIATCGPGTFITIDIGARYSIKNITDKQAILMVLKKSKS